ncbi:uncharacterized protein [Ptychodera flava]|uniref:uncharacterized protein n=1 Tax=Ptychodera flava TaxID=63121 RepID=UPI003969E341
MSITLFLETVLVLAISSPVYASHRKLIFAEKSCDVFNQVVAGCDENSECVVGDFGPHCRCLDGFVMDGSKRCISSEYFKGPEKGDVGDEELDREDDIILVDQKRDKRSESLKEDCGASCLPGTLIKRALMSDKESGKVLKKRDAKLGCIEGMNCPHDGMRKREADKDCGASCLPGKLEKRNADLNCIEGVDCPYDKMEKRDADPDVVPEIEKRDVKCIEGINCPPPF